MTVMWTVWHQPTNRFLLAHRDPARIVPVFVYLRRYQILCAVAQLTHVPEPFRCEQWGLPPQYCRSDAPLILADTCQRVLDSSVDTELMEKAQWVQSMMPQLPGSSFDTLCSKAVKALTTSALPKYQRLCRITPDQSISRMRQQWENTL